MKGHLAQERLRKRSFKQKHKHKVVRVFSCQTLGKRHDSTFNKMVVQAKKKVECFVSSRLQLRVILWV
eukprot:1365088-Amphidinium_carterae.1